MTATPIDDPSLAQDTKPNLTHIDKPNPTFAKPGAVTVGLRLVTAEWTDSEASHKATTVFNLG